MNPTLILILFTILLILSLLISLQSIFRDQGMNFSERVEQYRSIDRELEKDKIDQKDSGEESAESRGFWQMLKKASKG